MVSIGGPLSSHMVIKEYFYFLAATQFALSMGFNETSLETEESVRIYEEWVNGSCQPNHWRVS